MSKKTNLVLLVIIFLFMIIALSTIFISRQSYRLDYVEIGKFTDEYINEKRVYMKIYYFPWESHTVTPLTEKELISASFINIVTVVPFTSTFAYTNSIRTLLQNLQNSEEDTKNLSFRYSFVYYSGKKTVFQISLALSKPVALVINGKRYKPTQELIESLMQFLIYRNYKIVRKDLEEQGFFPPQQQSK